MAPIPLARVPFWFLRHGETDWNARNLSQGNVEVPLDAAGIEQARLAAERLRGREIATILCSPLSRARDTAAMVAAELGLPVEIQDSLREVSFGAKEGQPMAGWFPDWIAGRFTPEGAESFAALRERAVAAINRAVTKPPAVLVVSHGAFFRSLRSAMGLEPNVRWPNAAPTLCTPPVADGGAWELEVAMAAVATSGAQPSVSGN
jgi:broad specificity phosphatase PhoE